LFFSVFLLILFVIERVSISKQSSTFQHSTFILPPSFSIPQVISVALTYSTLLMLFMRLSSILLLISINPIFSVL